MNNHQAIGVWLLASVLLIGCRQSGVDQLISVQFCLTEKADREKFLETLESIARENNMEFFDSGIEARNSMRVMGRDPGYQMVVATVGDPNGLRVVASNFGPSGHDVSLSVKGARKQAETRVFAASVRQSLSEQWKLYPRIAETGAFPMEECRRVNMGTHDLK